MRTPATRGAVAGLALVLASGACAGPRPHPPRGVLVLTVEGLVEEGPFTFGEEDVPELPQRTLRVAVRGERPHEVKGVAVLKLLEDHVDVKPGADLVVFHGAGGRQGAVPLAVLRQMQPVLTWSATAAGGRGLALAWPTGDQPGIDRDPRLASWTLGGVSRITVERYGDRMGRALRVPAGAGDLARRGAATLEARCLGCHAFAGAGGTAGPALRPALSSDAGFESTVAAHVAQLAAEGLQAPTPPPGEPIAREIRAFLAARARASTPRDPGQEPTPVPAASDRLD